MDRKLQAKKRTVVGNITGHKELIEAYNQLGHFLSGPVGIVIEEDLIRQTFFPSIDEKNPNENSALIKEGKSALVNYIFKMIQKGEKK